MTPIVKSIIDRTQSERKRWDKMLEAEGLERMQLLLDTSTFDCNKPNIAELFSLTHGVDYTAALDTRSDRRVNISIDPGTLVRFNLHHDKHSYAVPSVGLILKKDQYVPVRDGRPDNGKLYMIALDDRGKMGSLLYIYNPWKPVFEPFDEVRAGDVEEWLEGALSSAKSAPVPYYNTLRTQLHEATGVYI